MFDLTSVEATNDFDLIPNGMYPAYIDRAEWKVSKAGAKYLNVMFKLAGEKYEGRAVFHMFNLMHPKENVKNIALAELKKLLIASGKEKMAFTSEEEVISSVLDCRCMIKLGAQKSEEYGDKNIVKGYESFKPAAMPTVSDDSIPF